MSRKYAALGGFLETVTDNEITVSFAQIERLLGEALPKSASDYDAWWSNSPVAGRHNKIWLDRGWQTADLNRKAKTVRFHRIGNANVASDRSAARRIDTEPSPTLLEIAPVAALNEISLKFAWRVLGSICLDTKGGLTFPTVADGPGLYRLRVNGDRQPQFYIGESQSLRSRFRNYRTGSKGQATSHRINLLLKNALIAGASISVDVVVDHVELAINGLPMIVDLHAKATRRMIEHAAIVATGGSDIELANL